MFTLWLDVFLIIIIYPSFPVFAKVRKTISEFFQTGISPQPKERRSSDIGQGGMDASPEISEEDILISTYQESS